MKFAKNVIWNFDFNFYRIKTTSSFLLLNVLPFLFSSLPKITLKIVWSPTVVIIIIVFLEIFWVVCLLVAIFLDIQKQPTWPQLDFLCFCYFIFVSTSQIVSNSLKTKLMMLFFLLLFFVVVHNHHHQHRVK